MTPCDSEQMPLQPQGDHDSGKIERSGIVCGTDFSQQAIQAVETAFALANRLGEPLVLAHAFASHARAVLPSDLVDSLCLFERARLHEERSLVEGRNVAVIEDFRPGDPAEMLIDSAAKRKPHLLVVSTHGCKRLKSLMLGSVAERVAETASVPTLVVRDATPFKAWLAGKRRLRVLVGADLSEPSAAALRWVRWFRELAPCDIVVAFLQGAPPALAPFEMFPSSVASEMLLRTEQIHVRGLRQIVRESLGQKGVRLRIERNWERSDAHLIHVAGEERVDLIVVGTHQRHGLSRMGQLSVSRGILHYAPMSVACVPVEGHHLIPK